jgi:serine protease Do
MKKLLASSTAFFLLMGAFAQEIKEEVKIVQGKPIEVIEAVKVIGRSALGDTVPGQKADQQKIITIRLRGDKAEEKKYTVEIDGDKIKVNGKDIADLKDLKDIDVSVGKSRFITRKVGPNSYRIYSDGANALGGLSEVPGHNIARAARPLKTIRSTGQGPLLGIGMEKTEEGVKVTNITEGSGAEKAGLKEDDIIVKLDGKEIKGEMDITKIVTSHKVGDEIDIVYKRNGKENKTRATLGQRSNGFAFGFSQSGDQVEDQVIAFSPDANTVPGQAFEYKVEGFPLNLAEGKPSVNLNDYYGQMNWTASRQRLGVSVKETEDGKGMEVINAEENSVAAKAGITTGDIITEVGGKAVNSVEDIRKAVSEQKDKAFTVTYTRKGKTMNAEIRFPKNLRQTRL